LYNFGGVPPSVSEKYLIFLLYMQVTKNDILGIITHGVRLMITIGIILFIIFADFGPVTFGTIGITFITFGIICYRREHGIIGSIMYSFFWPYYWIDYRTTEDEPLYDFLSKRFE